MKNLKYIIISVLLITLFSCSEEEFLKESPSGLFTTGNMYLTKNQMESAVNQLYRNYRYMHYSKGDVNFLTFDLQVGTDLQNNLVGTGDQRFGNYSATLDPTGGTPKQAWIENYNLIANANTILSRLSDSDLTDQEKSKIEAKAKLFRALGYRYLTYVFGGIPLLLEELSESKVDFIRNTKTECLAQIISDLEFCALNLPGINEVKDGEISNAVANHVLAEVYLAQGENQKAIDAATKVINNPNLALMTARFGTSKNEPGDVYRDLFIQGNQNRSAGNKEGIWVMQFEMDVPGGAMPSAGLGNGEGFTAERFYAPLNRDIKRLDNAKTKANFLWPVSDYTGGRGVGYGAPTYYYTHTIWKNENGNIPEGVDIRDSKYNLTRYYLYNNPKGNYPLGTVFECETNPENVISLKNTGSWSRFMYPYEVKVTTPGKHPESLIDNKELLTLKTAAGITYCDWYDIRLAETYLLRAEAYLAINPQKAADDINTVRQRAQATPITASDLDIDFILDERMRELGVEEKRRFTLVRLGKLYDRVKAHNPYNASNILPHHELYPIPQSEIDANNGAVLKQNPGYN